MSEATSAGRRRYKRQSPAEEAEMVSLWEAGGLGAEDLAIRFGMSQRGVQAALARLGAVKGRVAEEAVKEASKRVLAAPLVIADDHAARSQAAREDAFRNACRLEQLAMASAEAAIERLGAHAAGRALDLASAVLARTRNVKWAALGIDSRSTPPGDLPELPVRDMTGEEIEAIRGKQRAEDEALGIEPPAEEPHEEIEIVEEGEEPAGEPVVEWGGGDDGPL